MVRIKTVGLINGEYYEYDPKGRYSVKLNIEDYTQGVNLLVWENDIDVVLDKINGDNKNESEALRNSNIKLQSSKLTRIIEVDSLESIKENIFDIVNDNSMIIYNGDKDNIFEGELELIILVDSENYELILNKVSKGGELYDDVKDLNIAFINKKYLGTILIGSEYVGQLPQLINHLDMALNSKEGWIQEGGHYIPSSEYNDVSKRFVRELGNTHRKIWNKTYYGVPIILTHELSTFKSLLGQLSSRKDKDEISFSFEVKSETLKETKKKIKSKVEKEKSNFLPSPKQIFEAMNSDNEEEVEEKIDDCFIGMLKKIEQVISEEEGMDVEIKAFSFDDLLESDDGMEFDIEGFLENIFVKQYMFNEREFQVMLDLEKDERLEVDRIYDEIVNHGSFTKHPMDKRIDLPLLTVTKAKIKKALDNHYQNCQPNYPAQVHFLISLYEQILSKDKRKIDKANLDIQSSIWIAEREIRRNTETLLHSPPLSLIAHTDLAYKVLDAFTQINQDSVDNGTDPIESLISLLLAISEATHEEFVNDTRNYKEAYSETIDEWLIENDLK